ncbi:MAG TPA: hypothetical protein VF779_01650 [Pyrinomonadaceae bacterium]
MRFDEIGLKAVRFAILFNGLTYGVNSDAPRPRQVGEWIEWDFTPPQLSDEFIEDFRDLVRRFGTFNGTGTPRILLMPVIVGFDLVASSITPANKSALPPFSDFYDNGAPNIPPTHYVASRRARALQTDSNRELFLRYVVERLLSEFVAGGPLEAYRTSIHSWDLCGEPDLVAAQPRVAANPVHPITFADMVAYLDRGIRLVQRYGFRATVGFQRVAGLLLWQSYLPAHLLQFHYYGEESLPCVLPGWPALIGEVATQRSGLFDQEFRRRFHRGPTEPIELADRLEWLEWKGYREVFLWSAFHAHGIFEDNSTRWTAHEQQEALLFIRQRHRRLGLSNDRCAAPPSGPRPVIA